MLKGFLASAKFIGQPEDLIDCLEVKWPYHSFCFEVDWSSGHDKAKHDALNASNINMLPGGRNDKGKFHPSVITKEMLGENH